MVSKRNASSRWGLIAALRELRASLHTSLILSLALAIGVAVLVFSHSLGATFRAAVETESRGLLGADVTLTYRYDLPEEIIEKIHSDATLAYETRFRSMVTFGDKEGRLVQVRGIEGPFPFYGDVVTAPKGAWSRLGERGVLVDEALLAQTGSSVGDLVRLGSLELPILGAVERMPGESPFSGFVAPRLYLHKDLLPETLLLQKGSIAQGVVYMKFRDDASTQLFLENHQKQLEGNSIEVTTIEKRREMLGDVSRNVRLFFDTVGIISVILGAATSAAILGSFIRRKRLTIGIIKCIGATTGQIRAYTFFYLLFIALLGTVIGGAIGLTARAASVSTLASLLKLDIPDVAILESMVVGAIVALCSALAGWQEMSRLHTVSPLLVFRPTQDGVTRPFSARKVMLACGALSVGYLHHSTGNLKQAIIVTGGCVATICLLGAAAALSQRIIQKSSLPKLPFTIRSGIKNISRPGNQTLLLVVSSGLALIAAHSILLFKAFLLTQVKVSRSEDTPNVFIYDIQVDQVEEMRELIRERGLSVAEEVPIVLMRLESIKGRPVKEILRSGEEQIPGWTLRRDYWSTYRSRIIESEEVTQGQFTTRFDGAGAIPISIEEKLAQNLGVKLGDELVWNIQGVELKTRVGSLRKVFWERMRRNAFVVFPQGVLEDAPRFLFFTVRTKDEQKTAEIQRAVVEKFPNVSLIDIRTVVERVKSLLETIVLVTTILSATLAFTALVALAAALVAGKEGRQKEASLYRIIGATRRQIISILRTEFLAVALLASFLSLAIALVLHQGLAHFVFKFGSPLPWGALLTVSLVYVALVVSIAQRTHVRLLHRPSFEGLREE